MGSMPNAKITAVQSDSDLASTSSMQMSPQTLPIYNQVSELFEALERFSYEDIAAEEDFVDSLI